MRQKQRLRGFSDIFGDLEYYFTQVIEAFEIERLQRGYRTVFLPAIERAEVFGPNPHTYTFEQDGRKLALRPEFTAGMCRAFIDGSFGARLPLGVSTFGPVFRRERPQKGRYRQFHQIDVELFGDDRPKADVEVILFALDVLMRVGVDEQVILEINTLGDKVSRGRWERVLTEYFSDYRDKLDEADRDSAIENPIRFLDRRKPEYQELLIDAPTIDEHMTSEAYDFFAEVLRRLDEEYVHYRLNPYLVRGLDYYTHTVFEFKTDKLGSQDAILSGGRYDGLIEAMGGRPTPAVGWAGGVERIALLRQVMEKLSIADLEGET